MHWANQLIAGWLSMALWSVPQPDYYGMWMADALRSDVMPNWPGV